MAGGITGKLSDKAVRAFVAKGERGKKLFDGGGLFLFITNAGGATWRYKYRIDSKEKVYSIGPYPDITLAAARLGLANAKAQLRAHKDPVVERRVQHAAGAAASSDTFELVAAKWLAQKRKEWSDVHFVKSARALERDIYPELGRLPIGVITPPMIASVIERIGERGALETAARILQHVGGVFRFAQAKGLCRDNPAEPVREVLARKRQVGQMSALIEFTALGDLLKRAKAARLSRSVYFAHRLIAFSAMRISNVVNATWREFDLDANPAIWTIPRATMKKKDARLPNHRIPLPSRVAAELRDWRDVSDNANYVFPSPSDPARPISREAVEKAYHTTLGMKGIHSPHGWRASFTTQACEAGFDDKVVQLATDHPHDTETALRYNRAALFAKRIELFAWWGEQLVAAQAATAGKAPHSVAT